jgi:AcrR family transcriptional regulator
MPPALRSDAAQNPDSLVAAARQVMADKGLQAPLNEIARRAGIGNATLRRRFPERLDLVAAVFADRMAEHLRAVEVALASPDAWDGLCGYVQAAAELQVADRGIADLITMDVRMPAEIEAMRERVFQGLIDLIEAAKAAGALRSDAMPEDIKIILQANAGLVTRAHPAGGEASQRLVHVLLDGLRAEAATSGPSAPSRRLVQSAMREQSRRAHLVE